MPFYIESPRKSLLSFNKCMVSLWERQFATLCLFHAPLSPAPEQKKIKNIQNVYQQRTHAKWVHGEQLSVGDSAGLFSDFRFGWQDRRRSIGKISGNMLCREHSRNSKLKIIGVNFVLEKCSPKSFTRLTVSFLTFCFFFYLFFGGSLERFGEGRTWAIAVRGRFV